MEIETNEYLIYFVLVQCFVRLNIFVLFFGEHLSGGQLVLATDLLVMDVLVTGVLAMAMCPWTFWPREIFRMDVLTVSYKQNKHEKIQFDWNTYTSD